HRGVLINGEQVTFSLYFAIAFSSLDYLFFIYYVIVTGFMNFLQLNPA
ncbi:hypothetical protein, partial [Escherichia coli]